jgi:hypothetical protein
MQQRFAGPDGVAVTFAGPDGVVVTFAGPYGVAVTFAGTDGVAVTVAGPDDVAVTFAGPDGVAITFAGPDGVAVTFALFGSLRGLIHPAVGFPARIKRCYVTPLEQVRTCVCARCDLHVELILTLVHYSV